MTEFDTTKLERESLEAHVDLGAMRYKQLESRLTTLEVKVDSIGNTIQQSNNSMKSVIITSAATIVTAVLGLITTVLMKF